MTENPFESKPEAIPVADANPYTPQGPGPSKVMPPPIAPGGLTPVLVFCLLFGIFGLIGNCIGGSGIAMMSAMDSLIEASPVPEEQKEFQRMSITAAKSGMMLSIVLILINFVVAIMLIVGTIGCFKRKESSRGFLRLALLAAICYSILKIAGTIYSYFASNAALNVAVEKMAGEPIYNDLKKQVSDGAMLQVGTVAIGVIIGIAMLGFYIFARSYLGKQSIEEHFAAVEQYKSGRLPA